MILFIKIELPILFFAFLVSIFFIACGDSDRVISSVRYEILEKDSLQSIILLKDTVNQKQLNIIADSLFNLKPLTEENYRVWFYYRPDWQGHIYYAGKLWSYDIIKHDYVKPVLDVTDIKSSDK